MAHSTPASSNARFWVWHNDSWVKLTLKPGQKLEHYSAGQTDEGWQSEYDSWELVDGIVYRSWVSDGCDCDGRLSRAVDDSCPLEHLHDSEVCGSDDVDFFDGAKILIPSWERESASQRDYSAEAMGY